MPSTFGQWLIVILALVLGGAGGWVARGRQAAATADRPEPMVEGDPVVGLSEEEKAAATVTATVDTPQPAATVDVSPAPAAVLDAPTPHDLDAPPAAASLAASHTPLTADDDTAASDTVAGPVDVAASGVDVTADRTDALDAGDDRTDVAVEADEERTVEPVGVAPSAPDTTAHEVDAEAVAPAAPVEAVAPAEVEAAEPVSPVIPAPRRAREDEAPVASDEPATADADIVATPDAETPDDFRRIQGVGPKMAAALQAAGIRTYRQLAELDEAALRETIRAAGLRGAPSLATWPQQAKLLAGAGAEAGAVLPEPAADQA